MEFCTYNNLRRDFGDSKTLEKKLNNWHGGTKHNELQLQERHGTVEPPSRGTKLCPQTIWVYERKMIETNLTCPNRGPIPRICRIRRRKLHSSSSSPCRHDEDGDRSPNTNTRRWKRNKIKVEVIFASKFVSFQLGLGR